MNTKSKTIRQTICAEKLFRPLMALLAILTTLLYAGPVARAQGTAFTYQGQLNDGAGPANGLYDFQFALFDSASAGNQVGGPLTNAATAVSNGLFTVTLDFGQVAFPGADRWLEIAVITNGGGAFATLAPRQQVTSTPYAIQAANAAVANSVAASNITGSLSAALLPPNLLSNNQSAVTLSGAFIGDGSGLTNLNAANLTGGTLADALLSTNVALLNGNNRFTGSNSLTDMDLRLRQGSDPNHGLGWYGPPSKSFGGVLPDGPVLYGYAGGGLGTSEGGQQIALTWNSVGNIQARGTVSATGFSGNGSGLTSLNAANLTGAISLAQIPPQVITNGGTFIGNGGGLTNINLLSANSQGAIGWTTNWITNSPAGVFTVASSPGVGLGPAAILSADVNGDGHPDLITANDQGNTLTVLTNDGSGRFVLASSPAVGNTPLDVVAADVNGDGKVDLITANFNDNTLTVLTNIGNGNFALMATVSVGSAPISLVAADVNGDGKVDLVCTYEYGTSASVLLNTGTGFALSSSPAVTLGSYWMTAADVNGDGYVDLIFANPFYNRVTILLNNGFGGFTFYSAPPTGNEPFFVTAADVNGDGHVDLITANSGDNTLSVLTNDGSGHFSLTSSYGVGAGPNWAAVADVNGDGKPDLISADYNSSTLTVLTNTGNGSFAKSVTLNVGSGAYSVVAADVNGDGRVDLASANVNASTVSILTNGPEVTPNYNAHFAGGYSGNGSGLTGLAASNLTGTVALAQLPGALLTNNSTGVTLTGSFSGSGASLTALSAANIASGTLADARLSSNVALLNASQTFTGSNTMTGVALLTNPANVLAGNGAGLTSLNASNLTGALADARLSANVPLLNGSQNFPGSNTFSGVASLTNPNNTLAGNGAAIAALNASNVAAGTLADARLSANVALRGSNNDFTGTNALDNQDLHLRTTADFNHGVGWYGATKTFAGFGPDGPMLYGYSGGGLGTTITGQKLALTWNSAGNVGIGTTNPASTLQVVGGVVATEFKGDGSALTNLNASQIASGTLPLAQLPSAVVINGQSGVTLSGAFSGNGAGLTSLSAGNLDGALAPNTQVKFAGDQTNGFANSVMLVDNADTTTNAGPALRIQNDGGNTPFGALSVSVNVSPTAPNSLIAQFGNVSAWVCAITNDGSIYSAGDVYARGVKLTSDRNAKQKFTAIDSQTILDKVAALPMSEWDYKADPGVRHLGPVAQDFHEAFGLNGGDDTHISVVDEGGVALAAIQGLNRKLEQRLEQKDAEIANLKQAVHELKELVNETHRKSEGGDR